jgi:Spore coat polysaccharide biosynthesis protein F, CMP-KDO synthetase homolog
MLKGHSRKFISSAESKYLKNSIQKPVMVNDIDKGKLISKEDLYFRRTNQRGISYEEICELQSDFNIIGKKFKKDDTVTTKAFKKAKIGVIVACRLKSSRLRKKALLPINNISSIERCLNNCLMIANKDVVVLATSVLDEDKELKKYTLNGKVKFWQGDPDDVISRYIGACEKYNIDIIIRVTADCCLISPEITALLLESHFQTGADYSAAKEFAVGTSPENLQL